MKLDFVNFEDCFDPEKLITSSNPLKDKKFSDNGIFSEKIFGNNQDTENLSCFGWISFGNYKIINPILMERLNKIFGGKEINRIISYEKNIDKDGFIIESDNKLDNIGLIDFEKNFLEILEKFGKNKNKNYKEYNTIKRLYNEGKLFIKYLPVFSSKLRPGMMIENTFVFDDINKNYNFLIEHSNRLEEIEGDINDESVKALVLPTLYQIQYYANAIIDGIINDFLRGKKGYFRKIILGTRINFSSRCVIIPAPDGEIENVKLPYLAFLELYKFPLINLISKAEDITFNQANKFFEQSLIEFNEKMYRYINELITKTKNGIKIILNRPPTINIGSMLLLNVNEVKKDYNDLTLSLSNNILSCLAADFDGDTLSITMLFSNDMKEGFKNLSPENLIISNNDGKFNRDFTVQKEQRLSVYILNN